MAQLSLSRRQLLAALAVLGATAPAAAFADTPAVSPKAAALAKFLAGFDVEHLWIAGHHVNWQTGEPDNVTEKLPGRHTHCSAFVASVAKQLGIYILRPPEHGQVLLANAQNEWLQSDAGTAAGWRPLPGAAEALAAANAGDFVVASYHNKTDDKPGHIAIVLPGAKPLNLVTAEGPDVMQAGTTNSHSISLKGGFAGHPAAWRDKLVLFFAHPVAALPPG